MSPSGPTGGSANPLDENTQTVREQIIDEVIARVATLAMVGVVVEPGDDDNAIAAAIAAQKIAVEIVVGNDETTEPAASVESYRMPIEIVAYLPKGDTEVRRTADRFKSSVYLLLCGDEAARTLNNLAVNTLPANVFGGGVYMDQDRGLPLTIIGFEVDYRHTRGNPTEAR